MRLFERMATLLRADAHGVLDQLEEHGLLLRQELREAELELEHERTRLGALDDEARRLDEEAAKLAVEVDALDADVELALTGGEEALARFAVRRLLPRRRVLARLRTRRAELAGERERLAGRLAEHTRSFDELRTRVASRLAEGMGGLPVAGDAPAEEEVDLELLRRRRARGEGL